MCVRLDYLCLLRRYEVCSIIALTVDTDPRLFPDPTDIQYIQQSIKTCCKNACCLVGTVVYNEGSSCQYVRYQLAMKSRGGGGVCAPSSSMPASMLRDESTIG